MRHSTASGRWTQLNGMRQGLITRCEGYSGLTIRKLCLPDGYDQNSSDLQHDWQSVGAQAVNHLANKMMLALFAPSRPFFKLDPTPELKKDLEAVNSSASDLTDALAEGERQAIKELDQTSSRPKLYEVLKHLIVTGNVLLCLHEDMRVMGIKTFCVKRNAEGKVMEILIREKLCFDELDPKAQAEVGPWTSAASQPDHKVCLFKWFRRQPNGKFLMDTWVDDRKLSRDFSGAWPEEKLPYRVLTWDLADDSDYGTGLVEDYSGDFQALSALSEAEITAAILASEYRWLVNPAGMTKAEDFANAPNGAAIPGQEKDINIVQAGKGGDLQTIGTIGERYVRRIGQGFLLGSAVTREAERVTALEIQMQAQELETSLGGAYSRIAVDLQKPIAVWLLARIKFSYNGKQLVPIIITGLDALSRNGDLDALRLFLADVAQVTSLPPQVAAYLKKTAIFSAMAAGRGLKASDFVYTEEEVTQMQQQAQQQAMQQQAAQIGMQAAVDQQAQGQAQ